MADPLWWARTSVECRHRPSATGYGLSKKEISCIVRTSVLSCLFAGPATKWMRALAFCWGRMAVDERDHLSGDRGEERAQPRSGNAVRVEPQSVRRLRSR